MPSSTTPDAATAARMLPAAIEQIRFARGYTLSLLDETPQDRWFEIPDGLPTNIAWQVGHLTVSQYGLLLFRLRGRVADDVKLIPGKFRKAYSRGTMASDDASRQLSAAELLDKLAMVHELALAELDRVTPEVLLQEEEMPWAAWPTKLGSVLFCPLHEQTHGGQIGLLRRALGLSPVR